MLLLEAEDLDMLLIDEEELWLLGLRVEVELELEEEPLLEVELVELLELLSVDLELIDSEIDTELVLQDSLRLWLLLDVLELLLLLLDEELVELDLLELELVDLELSLLELDELEDSLDLELVDDDDSELAVLVELLELVSSTEAIENSPPKFRGLLSPLAACH